MAPHICFILFVQGVSVIQDHDQDSTDLMKCVQSLTEKENIEGRGVRILSNQFMPLSKFIIKQQYDIVILGGLSGRLDQTVHTLSYLHKLRKIRKTVFAATDDNIAWLLDGVRANNLSSNVNDVLTFRHRVNIVSRLTTAYLVPHVDYSLSALIIRS